MVLLTSCTMSPSIKAVPTESIATIDMRDNIVRTIEAQQKIYQPDCAKHEITDARFIRTQGLSVLEEWLVTACGIETIYDVQILQQNNMPRQFNVTRRQE